ncbi:hypothetical protein DVF53_20785 [Salmonella enterica subsp. enterica serovar Kottbus]|nr:hypothetical protein [Salmonella enterica subsp. enterica serovar Kottbus]EHN5889080.1 DNA-binding protein [Salmonella enterica subsp. enterica serovar Newport]
MAVTYDDIISIAERLTAEGKAPTQAAIRAELGGGSFTTIGEALQQWRKLKAEEQHLQAVDIPEEIRDRMAQLQGAMWKAATSETELRIQAERQVLNEEKAQSTAMLVEAREAIRTLETESARLLEKLHLAETTLQSTQAEQDRLVQENQQFALQVTLLEEQLAKAEIREREQLKLIEAYLQHDK